ncbi:S15 family X-Pro dipeptidyl-peptidase [Sphingobium sp. Ant17]|nr:S15 family X-Pro dipeptidyl-peptidase [Sphingobium sp. Ant17]
MHTSRTIESASMTLSDGTRLDADVYRPAEAGLHPVLLMRQAYGRRIGTTLSHPHPWWFTDKGYIVVVQDVRGRGTSRGHYDIFVNEAKDGAEAVAWAAGLKGSSGHVGMLGFSYQGSAQLLAAAECPPQLKAIAPAMFGWDVHSGWAYENGAFRLAGNMAWATQVAAETARQTGNAAAFSELYRTHRSLPLLEEVQGLPAYVDRHGGLAHYRRWLEEPAGSVYWHERSPSARSEALSRHCPPALLISGWYDIQLPGVLDAYDLLSAAGRECRLIVGPWAHFTWDRKVGDIDFGADAENRTGLLILRWFDHWLKGEKALDDWAPITLFDMGSSSWRTAARWPTRRLSFVLTGDGSSSVDPQSGGLDTAPPEALPQMEWMVTDPWRPAPAVGGSLVVPAGPLNRAAVDARPDVMTFDTAPFAEPVTMCGRVDLELEVVSEDASFDISCTLSHLFLDGRVYAVGEGYATVTSAHQPKSVAIGLRATCLTIQPGERLRLSLAGACFPTYPVNPGTGVRGELSCLVDARIVATGVAVNGPSRLTLSVV